MFSLKEMLGRSAPALTVVDVGAMWLSAEDVAYRGLLKGGGCRVIGFEPLKEECDRLNAMKMKDHTYLPHFIGDGSRRTFHVMSAPMTSSLYPPNTALLQLFNTLAELTTVVRTQEVETRRLDDIPETEGADYIKADVQGAELDVLRGAAKRLGGAVLVRAEVEFAPMYVGQPLFADVDVFMRGRGFALHTVKGPQGRVFKPIVKNGDPHAALNQLLWCDAVYVKDHTRLGELTAEQLLKLAVIAHDGEGSPDLAGLALLHYDAKTGAAGGEGLWEPFMTRLCNGKPPQRPKV